MPSRPPRVCPTCGAAVQGRCTTCRPAEPSGWAARPGSAWAGGGSRRWRNFRANWLADHPWCAGWPTGSCLRLATVVDHIRNLASFMPHEREAAKYDPTNVQSLCDPCHAKKTGEEAARARAIRRAQDRTGRLW